MPNVDGYTTLTRLSRDPQTLNIPVVTITAQERAAEMLEAVTAVSGPGHIGMEADAPEPGVAWWGVKHGRRGAETAQGMARAGAEGQPPLPGGGAPEPAEDSAQDHAQDGPGEDRSEGEEVATGTGTVNTHWRMAGRRA